MGNKSKKGKKQKKKSPTLKRKYKDSLFTHLFKQPKYTLELYRALHPEDTETTIEDIHNINHDTVLVSDIYNDLGFCVKDKLFILVESQSTWSINIAVRAFLYLSRTYEDYLTKHKANLYGTKPVNLPEPELYVVYTKPRKDEADIISLSDHFFGGKETALDVKVKVLFGENRDDIIGEYVTFCQIMDEQAKIHGRTEKAVLETIRICRERNILAEYLEKFKLEVIKMQDYLFNNEVIQAAHENAILEEGRAEGRAEGEAIGRAEGKAEGRAEGRAEGKAEGEAKGRAEGEAKGRDYCAELMGILLKAGRIDDALRAATDKGYLNQLIDEMVKKKMPSAFLVNG